MDRTDSSSTTLSNSATSPPAFTTTANITRSTASRATPEHHLLRLPSYHDAVTSKLQPLTCNDPPSYTATPSNPISQPPHQLPPLLAQAINSQPIYTDSYCDDELPFINDDDEFEISPPSYYALFTRKEEELLRLIRDYDGFNGPAETAEAICKWLIMLVMTAVVIVVIGMSLGLRG